MKKSIKKMKVAFIAFSIVALTVISFDSLAIGSCTGSQGSSGNGATTYQIGQGFCCDCDAASSSCSCDEPPEGN